MDTDNDSTKKPKAYEILVRQHHRRLLGYANAIAGNQDAAQDIVQDAFVTAYENLEKFDTTKDFGAWIRGIVRNKCREWSRSQRWVTVEQEVLESIEAQHREWDDGEADSEAGLFSALHQCLAKLPDLLAQAVNLFYLQRLSGAEVASRVGADESAVRKRLQRARLQLGACIEKNMEITNANLR